MNDNNLNLEEDNEQEMAEMHCLYALEEDGLEVWLDLVDLIEQLKCTKILSALKFESCIFARAKVVPSLHVNLGVNEKRSEGLVDTKPQLILYKPVWLRPCIFA